MTLVARQHGLYGQPGGGGGGQQAQPCHSDGVAEVKVHLHKKRVKIGAGQRRVLVAAYGG